MQIVPAATPQAPTAPDTKQQAKLAGAAKEFEALMIGQMLRSARESSSGSDDSEDSQANSSLVEMGEQQFAQSLANSGGLGIAKMVVAGLSHDAHR